MKKLIILTSILIFGILISSCKKDDGNGIIASYRIDSVKQDTIIIAHSIVIPSTVHVYYTVLNEGDVDVVTYRYTINVKNEYDVLYQIAESHDYPVPARTERHDSTKIGVGEAWAKLNEVLMDNTSFQ
jgi:hypothetical protein